MKYVMFKCKSRKGLVQMVPIIFPDFMVHSMIAEYVGVLLRREHDHYESVVPISAGFLRLGGRLSVEGSKIKVQDGLEVYGESETLKLRHDPKDSATIQLYDHNHGVLS